MLWSVATVLSCIATSRCGTGTSRSAAPSALVRRLVLLRARPVGAAAAVLITAHPARVMAAGVLVLASSPALAGAVPALAAGARASVSGPASASARRASVGTVAGGKAMTDEQRQRSQCAGAVFSDHADVAESRAYLDRDTAHSDDQ